LKSKTGGAMDAAIVERNGDDFYFNSDDHYEPPVATAATSMLAKHIEATKLFRDVTISATPRDGALTMSGAIRRLEAYRDREIVKQAFAAQMGLVGMIIQATDDSTYEADALLGGVKLVDPATATVLWQGDAVGRVAGAAPLVASSLAVYQHADLALKLAVEQLVAQLAALPPSVAAGDAPAGAAPPAAPPHAEHASPPQEATQTATQARPAGAP
jgi:hypothetical protein